MAVDSAVSASNLEVAPLAALLGYHGDLEGVIRDVKFTFRGVPERALDGQGSLRLAADGFRLNKRGWESLQLGARMIHRGVAVSDLVLKQKENTLRRQRRVFARSRLAGNGEGARFCFISPRPLTILARWQACSDRLSMR